jgi:hypothetical protein
MRAQMRDLRDDILQRDGADALAILEVGIARDTTHSAAARMAQPGRDIGHALQHFRACISAFIAPQSEWPQTMMSRTPSAITAYSTVEETPPFCFE